MAQGGIGNAPCRRALVAEVETIDPPESWTEVVEKSLAYPYANAVNGALLHYDWTDLLK